MAKCENDQHSPEEEEYLERREEGWYPAFRWGEKEGPKRMRCVMCNHILSEEEVEMLRMKIREKFPRTVNSNWGNW